MRWWPHRLSIDKGAITRWPWHYPPDTTVPRSALGSERHSCDDVIEPGYSQGGQLAGWRAATGKRCEVTCQRWSVVPHWLALLVGDLIWPDTCVWCHRRGRTEGIKPVSTGIRHGILSHYDVDNNSNTPSSTEAMSALCTLNKYYTHHAMLKELTDVNQHVSEILQMLPQKTAQKTMKDYFS